MSYAGFVSVGIMSSWIQSGYSAASWPSCSSAPWPSFFKGPPAYASDASSVMYFYRDDCSFCIKQKPILEELSAEGTA